MINPASGSKILKLGGLIEALGYALCMASLLFGLNSKGEPWYSLAFLACVAILAGVTIFYILARSLSSTWKTLAVRSYFSPYIIGATIWISLFVILFLVNRFFG